MSFLSDFIRCPLCKGHLKIINHSFVCEHCQTTYQRKGIPDLVPPNLDEEIRRSIQPWEEINFDYNKFIQQSQLERMQAIDKPLLEQCPKGGKVLEVGCGTARLGKEVEKAGSTYFGIDPSLKMLEEGSKDNQNLARAVGEYLPFADNSFETIISGYHSFRYIDQEKGIGECARVLKTGGTLAFPLWNYWTLRLYSVPDIIQDLPNFSLKSRNEICNDVKWVGNEINLLKNHGFNVKSILSTKNSPLSRISSRFGWQGYWQGKWGTLLGYDIIFICEKLE